MHVRNAHILSSAFCVCALLGRGGTPGAGAQQRPAFEVASIKANRSGAPGQEFKMAPDGGFVVTNTTARALIRLAYRVQDFQIAPPPSWADTDRFDINARAPAGTGAETLPQMLQALLEERFNLRAHREAREMPIYALVLNRADAAFGPQLKRTAADATSECVIARKTPGGRGRADGRVCGISMAAGTMIAGDARLEQLVTLLSPLVGRTTVDRTGLADSFDFDLKWAPDLVPAAAGAASQVGSDPNAPSIFTALQEQLGLRLDSQRGPVEMLVIDQIERPSAN